MKQARRFVIIAIVGVAYGLPLIGFIASLGSTRMMLANSTRDSAFVRPAPYAISLPPHGQGAPAASPGLVSAVDKQEPVEVAPPVPGRLAAQSVNPGADSVAGGFSTLSSESAFDRRAAAASTGHEGSEQ